MQTKQEPHKAQHNETASQLRERSYQLAKLLRSGNRELSRQLNIKRAKKNR